MMMTAHDTSIGSDDDIDNLFTDDDAATFAGETSGGNGGTPFSQPTPEGAAKKVSEVLGEVVWLMSQSPLHKQFFISDLEWFAMTPILLKQFRLFYAKDRPIGVVFWAHATPEVAERLASGTTKLRPQDWNGKKQAGAATGETQVWIVEVISPFGGAEEMAEDLKANVFADEPIYFTVNAPEGKSVKAM